MRTIFILAAIGLAVAIFWFLRTPSPVGHWRSAESYDRYAALYKQTFADMPAEPIFYIRTDFGVVRAYRFAGTKTAKAPLLCFRAARRP